MKKRFFLIVLLVAVWVCGCDNFGVKIIRDTYLVLNNINETDVSLICKSKKLEIAENTKCDLEISENTICWLREINLIDENENFKVFYIPATDLVDDCKHVNISFELSVGEELYMAELRIELLNHSPYINKEPIVLKKSDGKTINGVFTYFFRRTI